MRETKGPNTAPFTAGPPLRPKEVDTKSRTELSRNGMGGSLHQRDRYPISVDSGKEVSLFMDALQSSTTMMLGESSSGLKPLDSFLAFTAAVEYKESNVCNPHHYLSQSNLILANRVIVYNQMATGWYEQGHFEHALWSLQNAIQALRQFHSDGGKEPASNNTISILLSNMGHIYFHLGDLDKALSLVIEAYHSHDGTEDEFRASLLFNFGRLLFILDQSLAEAESALTRSLEILTNSDSESRDRDVVTVQTLLLIIQEKRERNCDEFAVSLLRALVHQRAEFGYENESVADTLTQLANLYIKRGEQERASMFLAETLRIQKHLKVDATTLLRTHSALGQCLHSTGNHAEAMLCFRDALRLKGSCIYQEPPHVQVIFAIILYNVGMIQTVHGDNEDNMRRKRALQSFRICLDLRIKAVGRMHPDVASVMHNIGYLLLQEGEAAESLQLFRESLEIRCNTLGPNHHEVASSLRHIGRIYQDRGEHEQALRLHTKALSILQSCPRDCSEDLIEVLMGLGQAQHSTGCHEQALRSYEDAATLLRHNKQQGKKVSSEHIARVLNIMGNLALDMSNVDAASAYFAEAASLSENSPATVEVKDLPVCAAAA